MSNIFEQLFTDICRYFYLHELKEIFKHFIKVAEMIHKEKPSDDEICDYLVDHINLDIAQIADCSKRNIDDCYILLHEVITSLQEGKICKTKFKPMIILRVWKSHNSV